MRQSRKPQTAKDQPQEDAEITNPVYPQVLRVPLSLEDSVAIRELCAAAEVTQREAIQILAEGCSKAVQSGGLARAIVTRKIGALQSLLGRPALAPDPMPRIVEHPFNDGVEEDDTLPDEWEVAREMVLEEP